MSQPITGILASQYWTSSVIGGGPIYSVKIPHTGDTNSLDRCGQQDRYNFGEVGDLPICTEKRTRSTLRWGLGPCKNADSVHSETHPVFSALLEIKIEIEDELRNTSSFLGLYSRSRSNSGTHPRFQGSTRDRDRDRTPEHILVFRALLEIEIEIELRNTSLFLGIYLRSRSRSRSNSGTHPRFQGSTRDKDQDRDQTPEHILVFRALLEIEIEIAPVHGRGTLCTSPTTQKNYMKRGHQTNRQTNTHCDY